MMPHPSPKRVLIGVWNLSWRKGYKLPIFCCSNVHLRRYACPIFRRAVFRWCHESQWSHNNPFPIMHSLLVTFHNELPSVHMTYFIVFFQIVFSRPSEMFCWPTLSSSSSSLRTSGTRTQSWTCASLPSTTTTNPPSFRTWTSSRSRIIWSSKMLTRCHKVWATRCDSGLRWSLTSAISKA